MTFRQTFVRCFRNLSFAVAAMFLIVGFGAMTQDKESVYRPIPAGSPAAVLASCKAPTAGAYPGYVIIQRLNSGAVKSPNVKHIDKGINEVMGVKEWNNVRVIGFCR